MQHCTYAELCSRIFRYLHLSGVSLTRESTLTALKLIEELLAGGSAVDFDRVMTEIQQRLDVSEVSLPPMYPLVNRSSIGYREE